MEWIYRNVPLLASCARRRRPRRWWRSASPGCSASAPSSPGRRLRALRARDAAARRPGRRARGAGGADRAGRPAARARHGGREAAHLGPHPRGLERRGRRPRPRPAGQHARAWCCPGRSSPTTTWGGTVDPILPRLTEPAGRRPLRDALLRPARVRPAGARRPARGRSAACARASSTALLRLIGRRRRRDGQRRRHPPQRRRRPRGGRGRRWPPRAWAAPRAATAPAARCRPPAATLGPATRAAAGPPLRRAPAGRGHRPRAARRARATVVDGGAEGLGGARRVRRAARAPPAPLRRRPDAGELRREAARGAEVVVTDSNRRRRFLPECGRAEPRPRRWPRTSRSTPTTRASTRSPSAAPTRRPWPCCRARRYLRTPQGGGLLEFPEHGPSAAFDGDPATSWTADRYAFPRRPLDRDRLRAPARRPLRRPACRCATGAAWSARSTSTACAPGSARASRASPSARRSSGRCAITITSVDQPRRRPARRRRLPRDPHPRRPRAPGAAPAGAAPAARWPAATCAAAALTYLFERTTADEPVPARPLDRQPAARARPRTARTPSDQIDRVVFAPAARVLRARRLGAAGRGRARLAARPPRRAARRRPRSSRRARFHNQPRLPRLERLRRPTRTPPGWASGRGPPRPSRGSRGAPERPLTVSRLQLRAPRQPVRRPTRRAAQRGRAARTPPLPVGADGDGRAAAAGARPRVPPDRARRRASRRATTRARALHARRRHRLAAGPGARAGRASAAAGAARARPAASVRVEVGGRARAAAARGTVEDLDAGRPLRARGCGGAVRMGDGVQRHPLAAGRRSASTCCACARAAPAPLAAATGGGRVVDPGQLSTQPVKGVRVALDGPSWLVLGQSFSKGWRGDVRRPRRWASRGRSTATRNGWRAPADCRDVSFAFAPQGAGAPCGYAISAVVCAAAARLPRRRRRCWRAAGPPHRRSAPPLPPERTPAGMPLPRAAALALVLDRARSPPVREAQLGRPDLPAARLHPLARGRARACSRRSPPGCWASPSRWPT